MDADQIQLLMDVLGLNDRQVAKKLKLSHPTVVRWRTGKTDIPGTAEVAIDCVFGNGATGSAVAKAIHALEEEWMKFVLGLSVEELIEIAEGHLAIEYKKGAFDFVGYSEDLGRWQIYSDAGDSVDRPACRGQKIIDLFYENIEECEEECQKECEEEVKELVAEAERSIMLQYRPQVASAVLMEIYTHNMNKIDEDIAE